MDKFVLFLWQLPQNVLGLIVIMLSKARYNKQTDIWVSEGKYFGVSLGSFIILGEKSVSEMTVKHERGHQKQSKLLGFLYLIVIGLPSALGNLWNRFLHADKTSEYRYWWYYSLPWEAWADQLGNVNRFKE